MLDEGHRCATAQSSQLGRLAMHIRRPCQMSRCESIVQLSDAKSGIRSCSIFSGVFSFVKRSSVESLLTCVSTTTPSLRPKTLPKMTFAVFLPTPGRAASSAIVAGTCPPCSAIKPRAKPMIFLALFRKNPVVRIIPSTFSCLLYTSPSPRD